MAQARRTILSSLLGTSAVHDAAHRSSPGKRTAPAAFATARALPADIQVCKKPEDLPPYDAALSGADADALISLHGPEAGQVVVLKAGDLALIVVSTALYGSDEVREVFEDIRDQLTRHKIERDRVLWATAEIVDDLRKVRKATAEINKFANSTSEFAEEFTHWLKYGIAERATDLHVEAHGKTALLRFRVDGKLEPMRNGKGGQMLREIAQQTISHVYNKLIDEGSNTTSSFNPKAYFSSTVTYDLGPRQRLLLRCQNNPVVDGFDFIARFRLDDEAPAYTCQSMGYTPSQIESIEDAMRGRRGLIIVAGIPGSGKTTLVQTILTYFPDRDRLKFVTLDDPVEFKVPGVSHATIKTVAGDAQESAKMYMQAMESWLRGNPDVISMGEIRNFASGFSALTAAEVGCLGLATLHANSQIGIYGRLVDPAIGLSMHSITAPGIIALCIYQKLVPLLCQHCKLELAAMPAALQQQMRRVEQRFGVDIGAMRFAGGRIDGEPCPNCKGRGTRGQKVVAEVYHPTRDFLRALRSGDEFAAQDVWRSENDGRFDTDDMNGKPVFLHAFKNALDGLIDPRVCEEFGSFEKFRLPSEWIPAHQVMRS